MKKNYVFKTFCVLSFCCLLVFGCFFATEFYCGKGTEKFDFQTLGLTYVQNTLKHPIHMQINIDNDLVKHKISSISFEDYFIDLKNLKDRKTYYLNVLPGKYTITWQVEKELEGFIEKKTYFQHLNIDKTQLWVHISIRGDTLTID